MKSTKSIVEQKKIKSNPLPAGVADMIDQMNGFVPISGNYYCVPKRFDFWRDKLTPSEYVILDYIARHTWGYQKTSDCISLDQFEHGIVSRAGIVVDTGTGCCDSTIRRSLITLESFGLITRVVHSGFPNEYGLRYPQQELTPKVTPSKNEHTPLVKMNTTIPNPILDTKKILRSAKSSKSRARELYLRGMEAFNREKAEKEQISSKM